MTNNNDVPGQVQRELTAAAQLAGVRLPANASPDQVAERWLALAHAEDARADAYGRLWIWAVDSGQPPAIVSAIRTAEHHHRDEARRCRHEAQRIQG